MSSVEIVSEIPYIEEGSWGKHLVVEVPADLVAEIERLVEELNDEGQCHWNFQKLLRRAISVMLREYEEGLKLKLIENGDDRHGDTVWTCKISVKRVA